MSTNKHALVHEVIPYMDILTEHLAHFKDDHALTPVVRAGASRGIEVINRYYSKTDHSVVYRIAMSELSAVIACGSHIDVHYLLVLHPAYKTQYFADHEWEPEWTEEALRLVREEWTKHYKPATEVKREEPGTDDTVAVRSSNLLRRPGHLSAQATMNVSILLAHAYCTVQTDMYGLCRVRARCSSPRPRLLLLRTP